MNMLQKIFLNVLFSIYYISSTVSAYQQPKHDELFNKYHEKYGISPDIKCHRANCKDKEACLQLLLQPFKCNPATVDEKNIEVILKADEQALVQSQNNLPYYWIKRNPEDQQKYNAAADLLSNLQEMRCVLNTDVKKYTRLRDIINFYKDMPSDNRSISFWIKNNRLCGTDNPLQTYKVISQNNLSTLRNLALRELAQHPTLADEINRYQIPKNIERSVQAIDTEYANEQDKFREEQRRNKESKVKIEENNARIAEIKASTHAANLVATKTQTEINTALKNADTKEAIARKLSQLITIVQNDTGNNMHTEKSINQSMREIDILTSEIQQDEDIHNNFHLAIAQHKKNIQLHLKDSQLLQKIDQFKNIKVDLKQKINNAKIEKNKIEDELRINEQPLTQAQLQNLQQKHTSYKKEISQLVKQSNKLDEEIDKLLQEQSNNSKPTVAHAEPISNSQARNIPSAHAHNRNHIPIATATACNQDERCQKNMPHATQLYGCDQHLDNPQEQCIKCQLNN
jgi:hypothetical protein